MLDLQEYQLNDPDSLLTPCLLAYPQWIRNNLQECLRIAGSAERLRPHVKTHKTAAIVQMELAAGITKHKCATLSEAQMLADCGAADVFLAYPQVGPSIRRLADLVCNRPETRFSTAVEDQASALVLEEHFASRGLPIDVFLDVDTGMHRTGMELGAEARALYQQLSRSQVLRVQGLHVYDGQNHQSDLAERQSAVSALMAPVREFVAKLVASGYSVPKLICGGTPTFPVFAALDLSDLDTALECSPGTCVLSDYNYGRDYADMSGFRHAAVLMTRVISKQREHQLTVDLGHKAVAADPAPDRRYHFFDPSDAQVVQHNEEHLVLSSQAASRFQVGDVLYALPGHVCPTVALHSHFQVVEGGQVVGSWPVVARDRTYR